MRLQDKLQALKKQFEANAPKEAVEVINQATRDLVASDILEHIPKAGQPAPEFTLSDASGQSVSSRALLARGPLIVCFYRGVWWPYCNLELEALQEVVPAMASWGSSLVAISPQQAKYSRQLAEKHGLTFPILSDPHNKVAEAFGLVYRLSPQLKKLYVEFGIDLERFNGDDSWKLPIPARFILDNRGVVLKTEANPDYTNRPDPREIISAIAPDE